MPRGDPQQNFVVAGVRMHPANTHFVQLQNELGATQDDRQLFPRGHMAHKVQPHLHGAWISIGELFRVRHDGFAHNAPLGVRRGSSYSWSLARARIGA